MRFTEYLAIRFARREANRPAIRKLGVAELVRNLGFRYAETYRIYDDANEFDGRGLPDTFVLKPTNNWSTRGVMVLRRDGAGYRESLNRRHWTVEEIRAEQLMLRAKRAVQGDRSAFHLIAEERLLDEGGEEIPFDYKVFTFAGDPRFILQVDRNHSRSRLAFFDGLFRPLDFGRHFKPKLLAADRGEPRVPRCAREIIAVARSLSVAMETPFISVDTYATPAGAYVGELTPTPGGPHFGMYQFQPWFDEELGRAWADAINRLNDLRSIT